MFFPVAINKKYVCMQIYCPFALSYSLAFEVTEQLKFKIINFENC